MQLSRRCLATRGSCNTVGKLGALHRLSLAVRRLALLSCKFCCNRTIA